MTFSQINAPNFFILGAGRCGSTGLHNLLRQHPDIFMTDPKEPTFFCKPFQVIKNPIDYFELYEAASHEAIRGEASHAYLSHPATAKVLRALFPDAKMLITLRNPADRAYSMYHWMRRFGWEHYRTFEAALAAEEKRRNSKRFMKNCPQYFYNYLYFRASLYGEQLQRYFELFPRDQFHIIKFEEYIVDPVSYLKKIFQFLGVDPDFSPKLNVPRNDGSFTARFPGAHYYITTQMRGLWKVRKASKTLLKKVNKTKTQPLSKETRNMFLDRCASDLRNLYDMTGISFFEQ